MLLARLNEIKKKPIEEAFKSTLETVLLLQRLHVFLSLKGMLGDGDGLREPWAKR